LAFEACAASQGCMNNFTFGLDGEGGFGYYETICGGSGAGPTWHGTSGVHTHMINTRITDPESLERCYPVILRQFALRQGSSGRGKYNGGEGTIRDVEFRIPMAVHQCRRQEFGQGERWRSFCCSVARWWRIWARQRDNGYCLCLAAASDICAACGRQHCNHEESWGSSVIVDVAVLRCGILIARKLDCRNISSSLHFLTRSPSNVMENASGVVL
jgi:hypothetical protein